MSHRSTLLPARLALFALLGGLLAGCGSGDKPPAGATPSAAATSPAAPLGDLPAAGGAAPAADAAEAPPPLPSSLDVAMEPHTGDLDEMLRRRQIRMLVAMDRTHFYFDRGTYRGITADAVAEFDRWVNAELKTPKNLKLQVVVVPVRRDQLLPALLTGRGDVIATYVTQTEERSRQVAFADAGFKVNEVFVSRKSDPPLTALEQLAGREVWVRNGTAYRDSLEKLNAKFAPRGLKPVVIRELDPQIEDDEALEMVNAGVIPATVTNRYVAKLWATALPELQVHEAVPLRSAAPFTWAVRKDSPKLRALVGKFQVSHGLGTMWGNMKVKQYFADGDFIRSPGRAEDQQRLREAAKYFREYGAKYSLDWLLVAAQAYQESGLDHSRKSRVGAVGIMQVMPATAKDPRVGVANIQELDHNIEAGTKYLRFVIDQYYKDEPMTPIDKSLFAFASYNAGPARVAKLRAEAEKNGLDPNVWFQNVEIVAARRIGAETVTYCRNIYKYYIAYKMLEQQGLIKPPEDVAKKS